MDSLALDLRHSLRGLVRRPGFSAAVVLSLALGIGANTAVFSLVDAVLLKPLPVHDPDRLIALYATRPGSEGPRSFSYPDYLDYRDQAAGEVELFGYRGAPLSLAAAGAGGAELVWGEVVTANYFSALGVAAEAGRTFTPADFGGDEAAPLAVLADGLWRRRFAADPGIVGRTVRLNGHEYTVVGVARPGFSGTKFLGFEPEVWIPVTTYARLDPESEGILEARNWRSLTLLGRLAPGVAMARAEAALDVVASRIEAANPETDRGVEVHAFSGRTKTNPFFHHQLGGVLPLAAGTLMVLVGLVLAVACANVANLQLARAAARDREMALRAALGGGRGRLLRQLLVEGLVLSALGGLAALVVAGWLTELFVASGPRLDYSIDYAVGLDGRVLAFSAGLALVTGLVFGLVPSRRAGRLDLASTLKRATDRSERGFGLLGRRSLQIVVQVGMSLVLLAVAGLFLRSFLRAREADPGFATDRVLLATMNPGVMGYDEEAGRAFYRRVGERLAALPGVAAVSFASPLPLDAYTSSSQVAPVGFAESPENPVPSILYSLVDAGYFEAIGTPLVAGRGFDTGDRADAPRVAVVNQTMAERFWPGEEPIGRRFRLEESGEVEVVGVAADGKYVTLGESPTPYFFLPFEQDYESQRTAVVRTTGNPRALADPVRRAIQQVDPEVPVFGVKTMDAFLLRSLAGQRGLASLVGLFGLLALVQGLVGIYGVMSFFVAARTREIGVRMTLGARRADILGMILRQGALRTAAGVALGLVAALAAGGLVSGLLFGVSGRDPLVLAGVSALLAAAALTACYLPARRASRADPLAALRQE